MLRTSRCHGNAIIIQPLPHEAAGPAGADTGNGVGGGPAWNAATGTRLRTRHWRIRPTFFARPQWMLVAAVLVLHGVFLAVAVRTLEGSNALPPQADDPPLQLSFVSIAPEAEPLPVPAPSPPPREERPPRAGARVPRPAAAPAPATSVAPLPAAPRLYTRDGLIRLPPPGSQAETARRFVPEALKGDPDVMRQADPVPYTGTRFDPYFPPLDESAGQALVRRAVDTVVKTKEINLPRGIHLECHTVFGIPTPDCRMPPPPPSPKAGDERLNMAPADAASTGVALPAAPDVATCIDIYRAGKPLPFGCPVDTPTRAVDAELKAKARKGGGTQPQPR